MNSLILLSVTIGDKIDSLFQAFDLWVFGIFGSIQGSFMTEVARFFTVFGDERFDFPLIALGVALCFFKKTRKYGFTLLFSLAIGAILTNVVGKTLILRLRPYNTLQSNADYWSWYIGVGGLSESDYSFPSGHTTAAFDMAVGLALCFRSDKKKKMPWLLIFLAVMVMCSRVYLMVHYATDVIGGALIGTFAGVVAFFLAKLVCKLFDKVKFLNAIDLERLFKNGINPKAAVSAILVVVVVFFCMSYIPSFSEGGDVERCAYVDEYDCYNAARVGEEKYPPIDGKNYCKIHWKQLNNID